MPTESKTKKATAAKKTATKTVEKTQKPALKHMETEN